MCCCEQPNVNGQPGYRWQPGDKPRVNTPHLPDLGRDDELVRDLPGRCGRRTDSHCHDFRLVRVAGIRIDLLAHNGSGEHRTRLMRAVGETLERLPEEDAYWIACAIHHAASDAAQDAAKQERARWERAAAQKRIKARKVRNVDAVKVWIEPQSADWPKLMAH
jgi:hypothetical protein